MTACRHISFFLAVAVLFMVSCATAAVNGDNEPHEPIVHVIDNMPEKEPAEQLNIQCKVDGYDLGVHALNVGNEYQWSVTKGHEVYHCAAIWFNRIAAFHAYQPSRDANHAAVFWSVRDDGFYHSLDNSSWKRMAVWETD